MLMAIREGVQKRLGLRKIAIAGVLLLIADASYAVSDDEAIKVCQAEMRDKHSAVAMRDFDVRRPEDSPYVYGIADFEDIQGLRFRCDMDQDVVSKVQYLVKDPDFVDATKWVSKRPRGSDGVQVDHNDGVSQAPPIAPSPQFEKAPQKQ